MAPGSFLRTIQSFAYVAEGLFKEEKYVICNNTVMHLKQGKVIIPVLNIVLCLLLGPKVTLHQSQEWSCPLLYAETTETLWHHL